MKCRWQHHYLKDRRRNLYTECTDRQKVTKDGIKAGAEAEVTYYGDLEDPDDAAVATRIVTADAKDTEEAKKKTLTGTVAEVEADHIVLDTADPENTLFSFVGTEGMFDGISLVTR